MVSLVRSGQDLDRTRPVITRPPKTAAGFNSRSFRRNWSTVIDLSDRRPLVRWTAGAPTHSARALSTD